MRISKSRLVKFVEVRSGKTLIQDKNINLDNSFLENILKEVEFKFDSITIEYQVEVNKDIFLETIKSVFSRLMDDQKTLEQFRDYISNNLFTISLIMNIESNPDSYKTSVVELIEDKKFKKELEINSELIKRNFKNSSKKDDYQKKGEYLYLDHILIEIISLIVPSIKAEFITYISSLV